MKPTAASLTVTALLGTALGVATALLQPMGPPAPPAVTALLDAPASVRAGEDVDLVLILTNHGPTDVPAPLQGVLSLRVDDLSGRAASPVTFLALSDVHAPAADPTILPAGGHVSALVNLGWLDLLRQPGRYRLSGESFGPSGVHAVGPVEIVVEAPVLTAGVRTPRCETGC